MIHADTSVLASMMMHDSHSGKALDLMKDAKGPLVFNRLLKLEVCNAIRLAVAAGEMNEADAAKSENQIEHFLKSGKWVEVEPEWESVFQRSLGYSRAHTSAIRTRSFDILHVAAAADLGARNFWSFDKRQRALAIEIGLKANP